MNGVEERPNLWVDADHALAYLRARESIPHRVEALEVLCELLPPRVGRVLDLGTGDGSTAALVLSARPDATALAVDFGDEMLRRARDRFKGDTRVDVVRHDLSEPLPDCGSFDVVVSSFAIHHLTPARQRALYAEIFERLEPDGVFLNAEHVASCTTALHDAFLAALGMRPEDDDPSNQLVEVATQLGWLDDIGYTDVDCFWKWRELAVLSGRRAA